MTSFGNARILVLVYGILAVAATGRSVYQLITKFSAAPVAYSLSAVAAVVYIVATVALARGNKTLALWSMAFELAGVVIVGALSFLDSSLFPHDTVWSRFGAGYVWIPLVLPIIGLWALNRKPRS